MARLTTVQASHSYGVLDPHVVERRDTKFVGASLSDARNIVLLPAGGYTLRGSTTDYGRARRRLIAYEVSGEMVLTPNGGTPDELVAGTGITTSAVAGSRHVLFHVSFPAAARVQAIDLLGLSIEGTGNDQALVAEWWDGAAWQIFGARRQISRTHLKRRIASGPPGHAGHFAHRFRVSIDATTGASGAVFLSAMRMQIEGEAGDGIVRRWAAEGGNPHQLVITDGNIDVYEGGAWRCAIPTTITEGLLRAVKLEPRYDTILAFHADMHPMIIRRLSSSREWSGDYLDFDNIPIVDYGGIYGNGLDEVQEVSLYDIAVGEAFDLTLEGLATAAIARAAAQADTAAAIKSALEALPNVGPGLTVIAPNPSAETYRITFTGDGNANRDWPTLTATALDTDGYARVRVIQNGRAAGEPIISDARGWPAVGRFAQQRLIMAGLKSSPNTMLASMTGSPFDLNTELDIATGAFSYEIDNSENTGIYDLVVSRTLLFLGDRQIAYLKDQTLSAEAVPRFGLTDAPGVRQAVAPVTADNTIYYIQANGTSLRQLTYSAVDETYMGDNASVLSAHLIVSPVDMDRRRAVGAVDTDLILTVNADGSITALTIMKSQEVSGFAPWRYDGQVVSLAVDHANQTWMLARHPGSTDLRLERDDPGKLLDEAIEISPVAPTATFAGLERFNGRQVYAIANDSAYGPYTVSGGQITLPDAAPAARVGTWMAPFATDPEVSLTEETRARMPRLKRVHRAELSVLGTTSLAIAVNGGQAIEVSLHPNRDFLTDAGPLAQPVSGKVEADGMHGFTDHGKLTVTQLHPGHLTVRSVTKSVVV
jgi:hypothetical protein